MPRISPLRDNVCQRHIFPALPNPRETSGFLARGANRRIPGRYFKAVISDDSQSKVTFVSSLRRRMIIMARSWCNYVLRICDRLIYVVIFVKNRRLLALYF